LDIEQSGSQSTRCVSDTGTKWLVCCVVCSYPSKDQKLKLASAIISALPGLKDSAGITGFVSVIVSYYHILV